jgi:hypothetical protein
MNGDVLAPTGPSLAEVVAHVLGHRPAGAADEDLRLIRERHRMGVATPDELLRYRSLWVAKALRCTACNRPPLSEDVVDAVRRYQDARDALQQERARVAVDAAFEPEDGARIEGSAPQPR